MWCSLGQQVIAAVGQGFFYVFNDEVQWVRAGKQNACQVVEFCLQNVVFRDDHVVSKCLGIDDTFFAAKWMVRMEVKQCHAVGWFSINFRFKFSGFRKIDFYVQEGDSLFAIAECVFDGGADCIQECNQGVKLGVRAQENEQDVINKTFPKVDQVEESQDYGAFFFSHEQIGIGGSHPSAHGVTLVCMRVHEFEGAMFENEIQYYVHNMGWWAVCGMFVYRDLGWGFF